MTLTRRLEFSVLLASALTAASMLHASGDATIDSIAAGSCMDICSNFLSRGWPYPVVTLSYDNSYRSVNFPGLAADFALAFGISFLAVALVIWLRQIWARLRLGRRAFFQIAFLSALLTGALTIGSLFIRSGNTSPNDIRPACPDDKICEEPMVALQKRGWPFPFVLQEPGAPIPAFTADNVDWGPADDDALVYFAVSFAALTIISAGRLRKSPKKP